MRLSRQPDCMVAEAKAKATTNSDIRPPRPPNEFDRVEGINFEGRITRLLRYRMERTSKASHRIRIIRQFAIQNADTAQFRRSHRVYGQSYGWFGISKIPKQNQSDVAERRIRTDVDWRLYSFQHRCPNSATYPNCSQGSELSQLSVMSRILPQPNLLHIQIPILPMVFLEDSKPCTWTR